ncbi:MULTISPECIES: glutamate--tRNA ligase [unclassified Thermosipho (in: thermotogales)]|uniref:glutamate--tRNA ligase n=1 Tax=unclassified Thermosipho (in: thermotogales) TaxID=2676525 RepID=UPI0009860A22|nr:MULTISPECIES: glutamate--tRNA ligase [unclassified Thermosipho (in: thermotogales)]MBT1247880.1 glutamate--tRNA ligase [Thermosipho sp. 1244]OOC47420.1 glutamyl-tRNA synthetase [Thermosipho sp. 1223]
MVRLRFAPSPTGYLHVGGARTALFNFLYARKMNGKFILRIEDTDLERSEKEYEKGLINALKWLGLDWDEGPDVGGEYGPYRQSERLNIYHKYAQKLLDEGKAYEVYAYPEEIEQLREKLLSEGKPPHYTREMLETFATPERIEEYKNKGLRPAIYFSMPRKEYVLNDIVKGEVVFKEGTVGDFAIIRSNGVPIYNFACVIDDYLMKITHVLRGDDHLSNTVKQIALYEAFGWETPNFGHVSMILGPDAKKLSKRHGATSVEEFRDRGYLPQAVVNFLALLGWSHPDGKEIMSLNELINAFSLERLGKNPAIFDPKKLKWMNAEHFRNLDEEVMLDVSKKYLLKFVSEEDIDTNKEWYVRLLKSIKDRVEELSEIPHLVDFFFNEPDVKIQLSEEVKEVYRKLVEELRKVDEWNEKVIFKVFKEAMKNSKVKGKEFYMNLRIVLTGREEGPELVDIVYLLGKEKMIKRLEKHLG